MNSFGNLQTLQFEAPAHAVLLERLQDKKSKMRHSYYLCVRRLEEGSPASPSVLGRRSYFRNVDREMP